FFFFSSRRRHTRWPRDWSSDVCSSDLAERSSRCATVILLAGGHMSVATDVVVVMILLGLGAVGVRRHIANFVQLQLARDEIRRLAVDEERLRLARDLHDELGQTLSTVVLQSELVSL